MEGITRQILDWPDNYTKEYSGKRCYTSYIQIWNTDGNMRYDFNPTVVVSMTSNRVITICAHHYRLPKVRTVVVRVDLGLPWLGWPVRCGDDYSFGTDWESSLVPRIEEWSRVFDANVDEVRGWSSTAVRLAHLENGIRLKDELQSKLGSDYEVVLDPIGGGVKPFGDELKQSGA